MQTHMTFSSSEITGILSRIRHRTNHHINRLDPKEYAFLMQMDYHLRERRRTTLSLKQADWLLNILAKTK